MLLAEAIPILLLSVHVDVVSDFVVIVVFSDHYLQLLVFLSCDVDVMCVANTEFENIACSVLTPLVVSHVAVWPITC